jgi:predicted ester cyclase
MIGPLRSHRHRTAFAAAVPPAGSPEANAATTRRWFTEGWLGNVGLAVEIFADTLSVNGELVGPAGPRRNVANRLTGFPDLRVTVEDVVADRDRVAIRVRWRGTHTGLYSGVEPTGRAVEVSAIAIWRFAADGKAVENWTVQDQFGLLQQVGYIGPEVFGAQVPVPVD